MKLIRMTCAAMFALAPAAAGLAQETSYPDLGAIAKTGFGAEKAAPEKAAPETATPEKAAPSAGVLDTAIETVTGRPSPAKEEAPSIKASENKDSGGGETSYPDQGSIAKIPVAR